jgi:PAS domain S-box-containing protein
MKLTKRFIFVPVLLVIFTYLFYSAYKDVQDKTLSEFNYQQFALAKQASLGIEGFFGYYQSELTGLSKISFISELDDQGRNLLTAFYKNHSDQIEAISVIDAKGILKFTFPFNQSVIGQDISNQKHVKKVIETHKSTVSEVFTSVQGYRAIAYHIPIISGNEYKGSLAILIPINKLGQRFIESIKTGDTGYGLMISENGIELFDPVPGHTGKSIKETFNENQSVLDLFNKTLVEKKGTSICYIKDTTAATHEKTIKSFTSFFRVSLGNTFWTILIFTPEREVFATLTSFRNRLMILFSLVIIVIGTYIFLYLKTSNILQEEKKRKAVEKTLIESEKRFRVMFELSPVGIILIDEKGTIIEVNTSFCENLGYTREEIIGKNIRLFASPETDNEIENNISRILSGKTITHEVQNIRKDGTSCIVELYETMINLPDGSPGILSVSNDITEKKRSQKELIDAKEKAEESDKLKSAFLANMSHELRTPLNAIIGFSGLMIDSGQEQNSSSYYAEIILKSGQHLLSLVENIFDTALIETGQVKINYEKTDIVSLLEEVKEIIRGERLSEKKNDVKLILNLEGVGDKKYLVTDILKLKQVLLNLLRNALKFTDKGYIEFGFNEISDEENNWLQFYVKDTGIGIDKKHHDAIFNLFRQIDDSRTRKFGGIGIGLSIAKKTVEILGGRIWVESEPSVGSVFYFTIPVLPDKYQKKIKSEDKPMTMHKDYAGKTILIAEDEESNFDFMKILFTRMNIRVLWAKNGREAIDLCETDPSINLVLMDIKMPLLDGYEATKLIKNKRPGLPIIAQTAYAMTSDRLEAEKAGCDGYLSKPVRINQLTEILENYL